MAVMIAAIAPARLSCSRRRAAARLASIATRCATRYSQPPRMTRPRIEPAFLTRTRKDGLEGVLGVVGVAEDAAADAQDHRTVSRHDRLERRDVMPADESLQELGVGEAGDGPVGEESVDLPQRGAQRLDGHGSGVSSGSCFTHNMGRARGTGQVFARRELADARCKGGT